MKLRITRTLHGYDAIYADVNVNSITSTNSRTVTVKFNILNPAVFHSGSAELYVMSNNTLTLIQTLTYSTSGGSSKSLTYNNVTDNSRFRVKFKTTSNNGVIREKWSSTSPLVHSTVKPYYPSSPLNYSIENYSLADIFMNVTDPDNQATTGRIVITDSAGKPFFTSPWITLLSGHKEKGSSHSLSHHRHSHWSTVSGTGYKHLEFSKNGLLPAPFSGKIKMEMNSALFGVIVSNSYDITNGAVPKLAAGIGASYDFQNTNDVLANITNPNSVTVQLHVSSGTLSSSVKYIPADSTEGIGHMIPGHTASIYFSANGYIDSPHVTLTAPKPAIVPTLLIGTKISFGSDIFVKTVSVYNPNGVPVTFHPTVGTLSGISSPVVIQPKTSNDIGTILLGVAITGHFVASGYNNSPEFTILSPDLTVPPTSLPVILPKLHVGTNIQYNPASDGVGSLVTIHNPNDDIVWKSVVSGSFSSNPSTGISTIPPLSSVVVGEMGSGSTIRLKFTGLGYEDSDVFELHAPVRAQVAAIKPNFLAQIKAQTGNLAAELFKEINANTGWEGGGLAGSTLGTLGQFLDEPYIPPEGEELEVVEEVDLDELNRN